MIEVRHAVCYTCLSVTQQMFTCLHLLSDVEDKISQDLVDAIAYIDGLFFIYNRIDQFIQNELLSLKTAMKCLIKGYGLLLTQ